MKVLMVNNRLKVYGGEGTYMTSVGDELIRQGHDVQYFGLPDEDNLHGNKYGIYAKKSNNPLKLIKNNYNRKQFSKILDVFEPDIVHINLIYFTLTPSILLETKKRKIPVIQTIHDGKIVCPSYQLYIHNQNKPCTECVNGRFYNCVKNKCHKNSFVFSLIAFFEAMYNKKMKYYDLVDRFIFPSEFMRDLHVKSGISFEKTIVIPNFSRIRKRNKKSKGRYKYVLFFGRVVKVKGVDILMQAIKKLPDINFIIVGDGDMREVFENLPNCQLVGFQSGEKLEKYISEAVCSVFPSVWYENCPMAIQESIALGTPVLGSNIGGIPELIDEGRTGFVFDSGDATMLAEYIKKIYNDDESAKALSENCLENSRLMDVSEYSFELMKNYKILLTERSTIQSEFK